jgi:hypothetical protein
MTDFQSAFDTNTRGIDTTLTTQLSSVQQWANIPGSLVKASSSAAGYLWGFNSVNKVYVCQQPCTGNWTQVDITQLAPPQPSSVGYMSGPWIGGNIPISKVDKDDQGNPVYIAYQSPYTKMVNTANVSKYYVGNMSAYSSANWATYSTTPPRAYILTLNPTQSSPAVSTVDIVTDETNVYLLFTSGSATSLAIKTANNQTDWNVIQVSTPTFVPTNVFSTHTYIWLQGASNQKIKLPKPVSMSNSMPVPDITVKITSSSSSALYGIDASGNAMKTDETLQTGWAPIAGLQGTSVGSLVGDLDQTGLFAITGSGVSECVGDCSTKQLTPLNTQGYLPLYLTGDPSTKQLWMTSSTAGSVGNIFNRVASPDFTSVSNAIAPLDKNRDTVVTDVTKNYSQQTTVMTINQQLAEFKSLFTQLFGDATKAQNDANTRISQVGTDINKKKTSLNQLNNIQPTIQKFVVTLALTALVYAIFSPFGWIVHMIALVVLIIGIYLSLNNDVTLSGLWTRLP